MNKWILIAVFAFGLPTLVAFYPWHAQCTPPTPYASGTEIRDSRYYCDHVERPNVICDGERPR